MSFVSLSFAALYCVALAIRFATHRTRSAPVVPLLVLSWVFYAWHVPYYLVLILVSTAVDYGAARGIAATNDQTQRRRLLTASLAANLGLLGYFKYAGFLAQTVLDLAGVLGLETETFSAPAILLPIGISFYTFQSLSYTIDVYRGRIPAERSFIRLACYVAFFPQLVAGPIVRAGEFLGQFRHHRPLRLRVFGEGTYLILRGLFLKVVIADHLGLIVDAHWAAASRPDAVGVASPALLAFFAGQLFCDFAGYSDIARGLAYQLGFRLPVNFRAPYVAASFTDFWRRWHITLSSWMRDYVYVPLGGNRGGRRRATVNLVIVMLVSGLWHGANWTFVAWGAIHGAAAALERALGLTRGARRTVPRLAWFAVVQLTWIVSLGMFRANDAAEGWQMIHNAVRTLPSLLGIGAAGAPTPDLVALGWWFLVPVALLHLRTLATESRRVRAPGAIEKSIYAGAMLAALLTMRTTTRTFIYFQF